MTPPIRRALVLAAGNGERFGGAHLSKLLEPVLGEPLILRTLRAAVAAGIAEFDIVLGYRADVLRAVVERHAPRGASVRFSYNPDWQLENGMSALAAGDRLRAGRFALLMGDHVFEPEALSRLIHTPLRRGEAAVAVDSRPAPASVADEATRVRLDGSRVEAIGKLLTPYDALDAGMFVCSGSLFEALRRSCAGGDTTLSGGIRDLAARGLVHAVEISDTEWYDIDTVADLEAAEAKLASRPERA